MRPDYDIVILGGGCAGLSLASRLAASAGGGLRIGVVEPRHAYADDRTWCFWHIRPTGFEAAISKRWDHWRLAHGPRSVVRGSRKAPYAMVRSADFYRQAVGRLDAAAHIDLLMGTSAGRIVPRTGTCLEVETSSGPIAAGWVLDSRPTRGAAGGGHGLLQCFSGWEIEVERPAFDPDTVELMRFYQRGDGSISFFYTLPLSPRHALIEATVFSQFPVPYGTLDLDLRHEVERRVAGSGYRIVRRETGTIPMAPGRPPPTGHPRHLRIGTPGGAVRASTGYAFARIQRWAADCARSVLRHGRPIGHPPRRRVDDWMDRVFLQAIAARPDRAPGYFLDLFAGTPVDRLLRFLNDDAGMLDVMHVMMALPTWPFLQQAVRRPAMRAIPIGSEAVR